MSVLLGALSALLYGIADFSGGYSSRRNPILRVIAISQAAGTSVALVVALVGGGPLPSTSALAWSFLSGLVGLLGIGMLYRGLARGLVSIVSPVSALVGTVLPLAFGLLLGEQPPALGLAGSLLCLPAILLLAWERPGSGNVDPRKVRASLADGVLAGIGFGGFFICISRTGADSGLWPVLIARASSLAALLAIGLVSLSRNGKKESGRILGLPIILAAGVADMGANIAFLLATRSGLLSLTAVLSSLYPAPTVILGRLVLGERIPPARRVGIALAMAGIALIALPR